MKNSIKVIISLLLCVILSLCLACCDKNEAPTESPSTQSQENTETSGKVEKTGLWEDAIYLENKMFGEGERVLKVEVSVQGQSITFTINTDMETVGEALLEHDLIAGESGAYGMYIKKVNGITADYDKDQSYWAFYIDGDYAMSGVDTTKIEDDSIYKLEYTK